MKLPFVGRAALLRELDERYRKAQCADGGALVLRGDPGIGKSRLIEEFLAGLRPGDPYIVETAARNYASSPYGPIVNVVETWLQKRPGLFDVHAGLRDAVDTILRVDARQTAPSAAERRRCFDGVAQLFSFAAADAPTTVVIDDLHDADPETLQLLYHILLATRRGAFLLLAATRPHVPFGTAPRDEIARLERLANVRSVTVGPLASDECDRLVLEASAGRIAREGRLRIRERAEGNPLFAEELVRQTIENGPTTRRSVLPASIVETVLERFELLSEDDRRTLERASAFGRAFEVTLLALVAERSIEQVHATLRTALGLGLVEETNDPERFRFRHALTQEAVYGTLLQSERRAIHGRIFAHLRDGAPTLDGIATLAFHAHASGERESTAYYGELAGDHAAGNQAFESAAEFYERALSVRAESDPEAARVCHKLATAYLLAGFPDRAERPVRAALAQRRLRGDVESIAESLLLLAEIAGQTGEDERRLDLFSEVCDVLAEAPEPRLQARRSLCSIEIAISNHDVEQAVSGSTKLIESGDVDVPLAIALRNATAHALLMQRRYQDAVREQAQAVRLAVESGEPEHVSGSQFGLGIVQALSGKLERAAESFGEAAAVARSQWATTERAINLAFQAEMEQIRGRYDRAEELLRDALGDASRSDHPTLVLMAARVGIWHGIRSGDAQFARRVVESLDLEALFREKTPERFFPLSGAFAQYLEGEGRPDEAREILARAVRRLSAKRLRSTDWSPCTVMTIATLGDEADIPAARRPIEGWFAPFAPGFVALFDALVADRFGDSAGAAARAEEAVAHFRTFEFRFEEALALALAGRKEEALSIFERIGALGFARSLREELTPKNRRGRPAHELTAREREVAALAADGLTNREICDRLSVSEKTVETHLASIFAKLGVRARSDVAPRLKAAQR